MDMFLFILRENETEVVGHNADIWNAVVPEQMEWIHLLDKSGNYCSGGSIAGMGHYVTRDILLNGKTSGVEMGKLLGYDVITAENIDQAVSIAQTCPLVNHGLAVIEVRTILPLLR
jgi:YCII-related domain